MAKRNARKVSSFEQMPPNTAGGLMNMMQTAGKLGHAQGRARRAEIKASVRLARDQNLDYYPHTVRAPVPQWKSRALGALALLLPVIAFLLLTGPKP